MVRDVTMELEQSGQFGSKRQIQLLDNRELRIIEEQKRRRTEYSIDLLALEDSSRFKVCISWPWLLGGVVIVLLTLSIMRLLPEIAPSYSDLLSMPTGIVGGLAATACAYIFWLKSSRKQCFFSRHAKIPLVELQVGKPSRKEFKQFVDYLEQRIAMLRKHFNLSTEQQLSGEMRMLRRLSDRKVLNDADYKRAKTKLFNRFS